MLIGIFWKGWVRYYHYKEEMKITKPHLFFQNNKYFSQRIPIDKVKEKDEYGQKIIPNRAAFFLALYNNSLNLYQTREDIVVNAIDKLVINFIERIPENHPFKGGVSDFGEFKIGSCLQIKAHIPRNYHEVYDESHQVVNNYWIICLDDRVEKMKLVTSLIKLKVHHQRLKGDIALTQEYINSSDQISKLLSLKNGIEEKENERSKDISLKSPKNGYWIIFTGLD